MNLLKVATSALTALLFHLHCFSSLAHVWRVPCCAVLCAVCCVLCCGVVWCGVVWCLELNSFMR